MLIQSAVFGEIEILEENIYKVPGGLFGFEAIDEYVLIAKQDEDVTLMWLQAVQSQVPCFVVFDPCDIIYGYEPELEPSDLRALRAADIQSLRFLVLAVVPEDISKTTVNLKSPLVINEKERRARQVILRNDYPIRFFIAEAAPEEAAEKKMKVVQ